MFADSEDGTLDIKIENSWTIIADALTLDLGLLAVVCSVGGVARVERYWSINFVQPVSVK